MDDTGLGESALVERDPLLRAEDARRVGLLGPDEDLALVRRADAAALATHGVTIDEVADRLDFILGRAERIRDLATRERLVPWEFGAPPVVVEGRYQFSWAAVAGESSCPLSTTTSCSAPPSAAITFSICDTVAYDSIFLRGLVPHLVRVHGLFDASLPRRTGPERLVRFFRVAPETRARPQWKTERVWVPVDWQGEESWLIGGPKRYWNPSLMPEGAARPKRWEEELVIAPEIEGRRSGDWCVLVSRETVLLPRRFMVDGSEFAMERRVPRGATQFRRVERTWVAARPATS